MFVQLATCNAPYNGTADVYFIYTLGDWSDIADVFEIPPGYDDLSSDSPYEKRESDFAALSRQSAQNPRQQGA